MKNLCILLILLVSTRFAWATTKLYKSLPKNLSYEPTSIPSNKRSFYLHQLRIAVAKQEQYLIPLDPKYNTKNRFGIMDQVFVGKNFSSMFAVSFLLRPSKKKHLRAWFRIQKNAYIIHKKVGENYMSFSFFGMSLQQSKKLFTQIKTHLENNKYSTQAPPNLWQNIFSPQKAWANSGRSEYYNETVRGQKDNFYSGGRGQLQKEYARKNKETGMLVGCLSGAAQGAWDSSIGGYISVFKGIKSFIKSPEKALKSAAKAFEHLKAFFVDFKKTTKTLFAGIKNMSPELKAQIACGTAIGIGVGAIFKRTAIVNRLIKLQKLATKLAKVSALLKLVDRLKKLGQWPAHLNKHLSLFISNIVKGKVPDKRLKSIDFLSDKKPRKAMEALACPI